MTDYRDISRTVRGPMRRWWRQLGTRWWVLIAGLLVLYCLLAFRIIPQAPTSSHTTLAYRVSVHHIEVAFQAVIAAASLLWFLAALQTRQILDSLGRELPGTMGWGRYTLVRFRLALFTGWWALIPVVLLLGCQVLSFFIKTGFATNWESVTLLAGSQLSLLPKFAVGLVFVAALVALPWVPGWVAGLWWAATSMSALVHQVLFMFFSGLSECTGFPGGPPWLDPALAAVGVLLSLAPVFLLVRGHLPAGRVTAVGVAILAVLDRINFGGPKILNTLFGDYHPAVERVLFNLYRMPVLEPAWIWHGTRMSQTGDVPSITSQLLLYAWILVFQCLLLVGHYWLVRWVITPRRPSAKITP